MLWPVAQNLPTLLGAISLGAIAAWVFTIGGMIAIAVVVWKRLERQEARDPEFQRRLDADDERARRGSGGST